MNKHVRLISPVVEGTAREPALLAAFERPDLRISRVKVTRGPASIESAFDDALAVPDTIRLAREAEAEGVDALVIDCMGDPGLHAVREVVRVPVVGPAEAAMHTAAMLAHRFSVVTVLARIRPITENLARIYGLGEKLASVRAVEVPVLELDADRAGMIGRLIDEAARAVEVDDAHAIVFGCTGMIGAAAAVRDGLLGRGLDVPVVDPIPNAIQVAASLAELGLAHSKRSYPEPPAKRVVGFDFVARPTAFAAE